MWLFHFFLRLSLPSVMSVYCKSKRDGKDQESIQSSTTPDPGYQWKRDNITIRALGSLVCDIFLCFCHFSTLSPRSGVVLDCIDS